MARVTELNTYPVKGCAAVSSQEANVTDAGLAHDRSFMVVGVDGAVRTQRHEPRLALIHPEVSEAGDRLALCVPDAGTLRVDVDLTAARREVDLLGVPYTGIDQGDVVAEWLSDLLGKQSRLVRVPPEHDRVVDGWIAGTSGYADSSPVHLVTHAALGRLNQRIAARGGDPVAMNVFRPNIVVDELRATPHAEDAVRRMTIGEVELGYSKIAIRCSVTLVDQRTGRKRGPEPVRTLSDYRRAHGGVAFGTKFAVTTPGKLSVGDEVVVAEWGESEL